MPLSSDQRVKSYCAGLVHQRVDLVAREQARIHQRGDVKSSLSAASNRDKCRETSAPHDAERAISRACAECLAEGSSAIAPASEIINAQQRYLGSQEPRRVRGSTVPHRPHQRGAAFGAALAQTADQSPLDQPLGFGPLGQDYGAMAASNMA
jgi:hypothetical protein